MQQQQQRQRQYLVISTKENFRAQVNNLVDQLTPEDQETYRVLKENQDRYYKNKIRLEGIITEKAKTPASSGVNKKTYEAALKNEREASVSLHNFESKVGINWLGLCFFKTQCQKASVKSFS